MDELKYGREDILMIALVYDRSSVETLGFSSLINRE
jgi:hypothetical protein